MRRLWTFFLAAVLSLVAVPMSGSDVDSLRINVELRDSDERQDGGQEKCPKPPHDPIC